MVEPCKHICPTASSIGTGTKHDTFGADKYVPLNLIQLGCLPAPCRRQLEYVICRGLHTLLRRRREGLSLPDVIG